MSAIDKFILLMVALIVIMASHIFYTLGYRSGQKDYVDGKVKYSYITNTVTTVQFEEVNK